MRSSLFIDLREPDWILVVSTWPVQQHDAIDKTALWSANNYTPDGDVVRAPMKMETLPHSREKLPAQPVDATPKRSSGSVLKGAFSDHWRRIRLP
jgi:hypothetical protein